MTRRVDLTGISINAPGRSEGTQTYPHAGNNLIPIPAGSLHSPAPILKSLNLTQAVLDGLAVVFGLFFLAALAGSLPLAVALMVLGVL
jgi:hypothetical protein